MVTQCEACGAEARHSQDELMDFRFEHKSNCPHRGLEAYMKTEERQAAHLADDILAAIDDADQDGSLESRTALSTLAFVAAGVCVTCDDQSTQEAIAHTISELRHHVKVFATVDLPKPERPEQDLLSPEEQRHLEQGEQASRQLLRVLAKTHPAAALVALQHALIEVVTTEFPSKAIATALGCMQAVMIQVTKRAPGPDAEAA